MCVKQSLCVSFLLIGSADRDLGGFTPAFLWLLRDFYLELEEDGRQVEWKSLIRQLVYLFYLILYSFSILPKKQDKIGHAHICFCRLSSRTPQLGPHLWDQSEKGVERCACCGRLSWPCCCLFLQITPKDYLEQALLPTTGSGHGAEMKNKVRALVNFDGPSPLPPVWCL